MPTSRMSSSHMSSLRVEEAAGHDWHQLMSGFADIHYEQTEIFARHKSSEIHRRVVLKAGDRIVGGAQVSLILPPLLGKGIALVRFGPYWRQLSDRLSDDLYKEIVGALIEEFCVRRKLYLIVRPRPHPEFYPREARLLGEMGVKGVHSSVLDHYLVRIASSEDDQRRNFDQKWRYNLQKGMSHNLKIVVGDDAKIMQDFQSVYAAMVQRKGLNYPGVDNPQSVPDLVNLPASMKLHLAVAYVGERPIAGIAFGIIGDLSYYVFGCTNDEGTELKAGYALQWRVLNWLRAAGWSGWYDLGGTGDPGIQQFKKGFAGKTGALLSVEEFHYSASHLATLTARTLFYLRDMRNRYQFWRRRRTSKSESTGMKAAH